MAPDSVVGIGSGQVPAEPPDIPDALSRHPGFRLKTNPFAPRFVESGVVRRFDYTAGPLKPQIAPTHLRYYFDLYRWMNEDSVRAITPAGRLQVFKRPRPDRSMVVLISGFRGTGRTSLKNLLLYEIACRAATKPIVTEYPLSITSNLAQDAISITQLFIKAIGARAESDPLTTTLRTTLKDWRENVIGTEANPGALFVQLRADVAAVMEGTEIVVCLDASNHTVSLDTWRPACAMLLHLADYVIISLSDRDQASFFKANLEQNEFQVAWVDAPKLGEDTLRRFLERRLADERSAGIASPGGVTAPDLAPFTPDALKVLFSTPAGKATKQPELPISVVLQKLKGVFEHKFETLVSLLNVPAHHEKGIPLEKIWISADDMREYLEK